MQSIGPYVWFFQAVDNMNGTKWYLAQYNQTDFEEILRGIVHHDNDHNDIESIFEKYYPILATITIMLSLISGVLLVILTLWERFGMDPMKRGIKNRVNT